MIENIETSKKNINITKNKQQLALPPAVNIHIN